MYKRASGQENRGYMSSSGKHPGSVSNAHEIRYFSNFFARVELLFIGTSIRAFLLGGDRHPAFLGLPVANHK